MYLLTIGTNVDDVLFLPESPAADLMETIRTVGGNCGQRRKKRVAVVATEGRKVDRKGGDWWMKFGETVVGYWPASLFTSLRESAARVEWGGEVVNLKSDGHHTTSDMGSGYFPQQGFGKASCIKNIQTVDESNTLRTPESLQTYNPENSCYDIVLGMSDNLGSQFFFGGPGLNQNCP
ncbi:hypothetical protein R6Q59_023849 [Mikania micrantha]